MLISTFKREINSKVRKRLPRRLALVWEHRISVGAKHEERNFRWAKVLEVHQ